MEIALELIESMLVKFRSEKKWTLQAIEQLSEDDITSSPTQESNSIANLVAHIRGAVHSRTKTRDSFDILIQYLEHLKSTPKLLMTQPFLNLPPLTYSQVNNETTALNLMMAMFREVHFHTGQIIYAAKIRKGQLVWNYD